MAAKVVMVAVPTVLGIASIRVYTVNEVPADGLVTRERLNVYTPLPQSPQVRFVPESPGVIESGLTTAREGVLPFVRAVKGACVSVKRGGVNLYHTGQDVFYYLKDPPPGFLPRFGTITMAGLLGMFLARKGSRFKRVAVPLGLMSAGASVCYPAQTVAVFKVTGKKVYAAGKWSGAAVSSLFTSKEPVAKEIVASQPQSATVPNPEPAVAEEASDPSSPTETPAKSPTIPDIEVESAEAVPISEEPVVAVTTEEESSVISPDQAPTETSTDPLANSVPSETEAAPPSEASPAPVESAEASDAKQAAEDVSAVPSPAEPTPSSEPETIEVVPVESVSAEPAPVESAPVEPVSVESVPVESVPVESVPVESVPVESAPSFEEPSAPKASDEPAVPVVESAEPRPAAEPAVEETPTPTLPPPLPPLPLPPLEQPAAENSKEGSGFKPDPSLMDFGQSNPEDEDLYSTRS
ncbi:MICOS complex subunit MIC27 [Stegastes partitus]|uniref:MICOS complex subunit n=1 Tax=Stegastes partitus TaxID=144197 RepID=A0A3B4ZWW6_9TELE|nr:PREDICTED: apolipoprotein O-like [Stegastes partitus]